jgi:predicted ArsR family transcriptional regulator
VRALGPSATEMEALERVTGMLAELGFDPELVIADERAQVLLRRCPFADLAVRHGEVVCAAHLGIIRGALAELGADVATDLRPFVEPRLCVAEIRLASGDAPTA